MKFERLRLSGFKTFVDPTELVIAPGLTGIVGPNGCGKSNLVEALRWAMGETSSKSLRGGEMDDVIFAGAGQRPERSHAEVSIRLAEPPQNLPGHLAGAEALEISRKIVRQQGSTFRINGREVRARDVHILFADAASGARSPSLVRQGQISEIINAKPQHRRRILEDAAGTAGLHARRHEAELRLRQAEENLARAEDVLAELNRQSGELRKQARQAERYKAIQSEIRALELHLLASSHARASLEAREAAEALDQSIRDGAAALARQGECERARAIAEHEREEARARHARAEAQLQRLLTERDQLDGEQQRLEARIKELTSRRQELDRDREAAEGTLRDAEQASQALQVEKIDLSGRHQALEAAIARESTALAAAQQARAELEAQSLHLAGERAQREAEGRGARQRLEAAEARLNRIAASEAEAGRALAALTAEREALKTYDALESRLSEQESALAARQSEVDERERAAREARDAETQLRPRLAEAERLLQRLETEARTIRKLVDAVEPGLWTPAIDQIKVAPGYEAALAAALGEDLEAAIEWGAPRHWSERAIEGEPALPGGLPSLLSVVDAPAPLHLRLRQIGLCARADGEALRASLLPGQRLVSREGDLWRWDGYSARADAPSGAARRLAERNRLDELEREAQRARSVRDGAREALDRAIRQMKAAQLAESEARDALRRATRERDDTRDQLQREMRRTEETRLRLETARLRLKALADDRHEAAAESESARLALAALPPIETDTSPMQALSSRLEFARQDEAQRRDALARDKGALVALESRVSAIDRESAAWVDRMARAQATLTEHSTRAERLDQERSEIDGRPAEILARRRSVSTEIEQAEAGRKSADDARALAEMASRQADEQARQAVEALAATRELTARREVARDHARDRLTHIIATIEEAIDGPFAALGRTLPEEARITRLTPEETEARLRDLKQDRDRLGGVNLRAEVELAEVETRQGDLERERAEIGSAIGKFRRAIDQLNSEGRARLTAAFETVKGHFQTLFTRLFGGGTAELHLIEAEDPLDAGLEIVARPPGKRPQLLSLLSGGEQALTATALIFAVFLTNPAPICVLDEVDAPLDDSNVERLCALIKDMARETGTRFLVITHNPISMAEMDRLYGVTMAERGVSQLVSVDLVEAERLAEAV